MPIPRNQLIPIYSLASVASYLALFREVSAYWNPDKIDRQPNDACLPSAMWDDLEEYFENEAESVDFSNRQFGGLLAPPNENKYCEAFDYFVVELRKLQNLRHFDFSGNPYLSDLDIQLITQTFLTDERGFPNTAPPRTQYLTIDVSDSPGLINPIYVTEMQALLRANRVLAGYSTTSTAQTTSRLETTSSTTSTAKTTSTSTQAVRTSSQDASTSNQELSTPDFDDIISSLPIAVSSPVPLTSLSPGTPFTSTSFQSTSAQSTTRALPPAASSNSAQAVGLGAILGFVIMGVMILTGVVWVVRRNRKKPPALTPADIVIDWDSRDPNRARHSDFDGQRSLPATPAENNSPVYEVVDSRPYEEPQQSPDEYLQVDPAAPTMTVTNRATGDDVVYDQATPHQPVSSSEIYEPQQGPVASVQSPSASQRSVLLQGNASEQNNTSGHESDDSNTYDLPKSSSQVYESAHMVHDNNGGVMTENPTYVRTNGQATPHHPVSSSEIYEPQPQQDSVELVQLPPASQDSHPHYGNLGQDGELQYDLNDPSDHADHELVCNESGFGFEQTAQFA